MGRLAAARGAVVLAVDPDEERLALAVSHGAARGLRPDVLPPRDLKKAVREFARERDLPTWRTRIFECSGAKAGQETAFGLLGHGTYLSLVGYCASPVEVRLSNLPARRLYEKYGFRPVGLRPRYYSDDHEDALIMTTEPLSDPRMIERIARRRVELDAAPPPTGPSVSDLESPEDDGA